MVFCIEKSLQICLQLWCCVFVPPGFFQEKIETDEFVPDWGDDDMDDKYDDVDLPVGHDQPVNMQELIFVACTRWRQVKAEADAEEVEATEKPELVEEEPEEPSSEAKNADGGGLTPPAAGDGLTSSAASGAPPPNRRWQVKAETQAETAPIRSQPTGHQLNISRDKDGRITVQKDGKLLGAFPVTQTPASTARDDDDDDDKTMTKKGRTVKGSKLFKLAQNQAVVGIVEHYLGPGVEIALKAHIGTFMPEQIPLNTGFSFCTCCLGRGWQLQIALPINLALTEQFKDSVRFCVSLFKPPEDALKPGVVIDGASKEMLEHLKDDYLATKDFILENFAEELRTGRLVVSVHERIFFHSSICKNTAHKLALALPWRKGFESIADSGLCPPQNIMPEQPEMISVAMTRGGGLTPAHEHHVLVNLDADNIMADSFPANLEAVLYPLLKHRKYVGGRCVKGADSGTTGRILCNDKAFLAIGGYDQSFHPTGFQDIDLHKRLIKMCGPESAPAFRLMCGWSVPNSKESRTHKLTTAKTSFSGSLLTWGKQDAENRTMAAAKMKAGLWWRNSLEAPFNGKQMWDIMSQIGHQDPDGFTVFLGAPVHPPKPKRAPPKSSAGGLTPAGEPVGGLTPAGAASSSDIPQPPPFPPPAQQLGAAPKAPPQEWLRAQLDPPPKRMPEVFLRVVCCGAGNLPSVLNNIMGRRLKRREKTMAEARFLRDQCDSYKPIDEPKLTNCLEEIEGVLVGLPGAKDNEIICVDMRDAHDPETHQKEMAWHIGTHPFTLNQVSKAACTADSLRRIRRMILTRAIEHPDERWGWTVISYCRGGNHRSVAFGELLRMAVSGHNFVELKKYDVINTTEMAGIWEWKKCNRCDACSHRKLTSDQQKMLKEAEERVRAIWLEEN